MASEQKNSTAMIIRGADGKYYYVTDEDLAPHQLSDEQVAAVEKQFDVNSGVVHVGDENFLEKIGLRSSATNVIMVIVSITALRNWRNRG